MKPLYLAAALSLAALHAWAQQPDPADAFAAEWGTIVASDTLVAASHKHTAELAQKLVGEYQRQRDELKKARDDNAALETRLATTMEWLKQAQTGGSK